MQDADDFMFTRIGVDPSWYMAFRSARMDPLMYARDLREAAAQLPWGKRR